MISRIFSSLLVITLLTLSSSTTVFAEETSTQETDQQEQEQVNPSEDKSYQEKLNILIPSQESLFDNSKRNDANQDGQISEDERIRLADGDLEQGLAPRILKILIQFSPIAITVFFIFAGVRLIVSRGNEDAYTNTKNMIVQALIGFVLITASFGIILGIIRLFDSL